MDKPLDYDAVQALFARGCQVPGCPHTDHSALVLHGRCHPRGHATILAQAGSLQVACSLCGRLITALSVDAPRSIAKSPCHGDSLEVVITRGRDTVLVRCGQCQTEHAAFQLRRAA